MRLSLMYLLIVGDGDGESGGESKSGGESERAKNICISNYYSY